MRNSFIWAVALLVGMTMAYPAANAAAQTKKKVTVPAGTRILIRTVDPIDSSKQKTGYRFTATLETDLQVEDTVVGPGVQRFMDVSHRLHLPARCQEVLSSPLS